MRVINGKSVRQLDAAEFEAWAANYDEVTLDLGAGDGRLVRELAAKHPTSAVIGLDLCAKNLSRMSRKATRNALFVVGDALSMPNELHGLAARVTINFPWGSLLRGLLDECPDQARGLASAGRQGARFQLALNSTALAEAGCTWHSGGERVGATLARAGFAGLTVTSLGPRELRCWPTTWAKRLAFGRDPRAILIEATFPAASCLAVR